MIADHLDEVVFKNLADDNQESIRVTGCGVFMPKGIVSISYWRTIDKTATGYAIDKFAEAFGLCEDQEAEREKDLKILIDAVCEQEPGIPKCTVDRVIRTAFDLLEDDEEEDEDDE